MNRYDAASAIVLGAGLLAFAVASVADRRVRPYPRWTEGVAGGGVALVVLDIAQWIVCIPWRD